MREQAYLFGDAFKTRRARDLVVWTVTFLPLGATARMATESAKMAKVVTVSPETYALIDPRRLYTVTEIDNLSLARRHPSWRPEGTDGPRANAS
jgi:hypothetical protein